MKLKRKATADEQLKSIDPLKPAHKADDVEVTHNELKVTGDRQLVYSTISRHKRKFSKKNHFELEFEKLC